MAMFGFIACDKHECNDYDHSKDLVGTWTCLTADYAEALVIKADGSAVSTGVEAGEYWENVAGNIVVENGKVTMTFEDGDNFEGHFDIVPGVAFSIFNEEGEHMTYYYCKEDLSDEIVGMWVCNESENGMLIRTFTEDGEVKFTGFSPEEGMYFLNSDDNYKVFGDVLFITSKINGVSTCIGSKISYPNDGTSLGDILVNYVYLPSGDSVMETTSWLRIKQSLNFTGNTYNYSSAYVSNANGKDEDFSIMGYPFNIAKIKSSDFDMILGANLFCVQLNAYSIKHYYSPNGQDEEFDAPISVEGNKVTLDMSAVNPALRKVEMHMFQDADDTQLHMYMHTDAFINYFANLEVVTLIAEGKINQADETAIAKVFADMEARIESINVSFVFKARK